MHICAYSMGARLALETALYGCPHFLSLTCLSTTLHIVDREKRTQQEQHWIDKVKNGTMEDFIRFWYNGPLFHGFTPPKERFIQDRDSLIKIIEEYSILQGPDLYPLPSIPTSYLYREKDPKAAFCPTEPNLISSPNHCIHIENSEACVNHLLNFTKSLHL